METRFIPVATRSTAVRRAPEAAKIVKVEGGYLAFRTITAYETWRQQR